MSGIRSVMASRPYAWPLPTDPTVLHGIPPLRGEWWKRAADNLAGRPLYLFND